jgi:hypothetical protein
MKAWIAVGIVVAGGMLAGIASAGDVATFPTRVTMSKQAPAFHGKVKSDEDMCIEGRKVKLLRRTRAGRPYRLMGTDRAKPNGRWAVKEPQEFTLKSGIYIARAPKAIVHTPVATVCAKDASRKIVVD